MKLLLYLVRRFFAAKTVMSEVFLNPLNSKVLVTIVKNAGDTFIVIPFKRLNIFLWPGKEFNLKIS